MTHGAYLKLLCLGNEILQAEHSGQVQATAARHVQDNVREP